VCRKQVELAVDLGKPLFLHERDRDRNKGSPLGSCADLLKILTECGPHPSKVCIHCFTGPRKDLQTYITKGYMIGLTGFIGMTKRGAHIRDMVWNGDLPVQQLMLETDCPFMMPDKDYLPADIKVTDRKNEPCAMPGVCNAAAECLGLSAAEVAQATTTTACTFFGL